MAITKQSPRTIHLGGPAVKLEGQAEAAITPGMLVEPGTVVGDFKKHASNAGQAQRAFALGNEYANDAVTPVYTSDDDYVADEQVYVKVGTFGSSFWAWLTSGDSVAYGAKLESAGNGFLSAVSGSYPVAWALETVDATADISEHAGGHKRIRVEVM